MEEIHKKIEALLFLAGEPVSYQELARILNISVPDAEERVTQLEASLQGHGLSILHSDTQVQLVTSTSVASFVQSFLQGEAREISPAAAETLAIIAYRGPISRYDISAIRGVDSRRILQQLVLRGLIRKKTDGASRSVNYVVSEEFLQHAGITDVTQLPEYVALSSDERVRHIMERDSTI